MRMMLDYTFYIQLILLLGCGKQRQPSVKKLSAHFIGNSVLSGGT